MRRQWPCSKCGFACSSTWRSLRTSKPVICNTCRSKGSKSKVAIDPHKQLVLNSDHVGAKNCSPSDGNSTLDQISPSTTSSSMVHHENKVGLTVSCAGMIFGNLAFEPNVNPRVAFPVVVHSKSKSKPKVVVLAAADDDGDDHEHDEQCAATELQSHFCASLRASTSAVLEGDMIQIKQKYDSEQKLLKGATNPSVWDSRKVQRKKRSKLPQHTLSPLSRLINQLQQVSCLSAVAAARCGQNKQHPKYDDVFIYEKCKLVGEKEIGLGAMLLSPPAPVSSTAMEPCSAASTTMRVVKAESSNSTNERGGCLGLF